MMRNRNALNSLTIVAFIFVSLLLLFSEAGAQAREPYAEGSAALASQPLEEVTINGTVDRLLSQPLYPGSPAGAHLMISAAGKTVDAHLGPVFSRQNHADLTTGEPVEVTGFPAQIHGHEILLVRQLTFAGHTVTVRNQRGFLLYGHSSRRVRGAAKSAQTGDAQ